MVSIMGIIFYVSHQPGDFVQLMPITGLDKIMHLVAYGILAAAFLYALHPFARSSNHTVISVMAVIFCVLYGLTDEFHQSFIPGRVVSLLDVVADGLGALLTVGVWLRRQVKDER